MGCASARPSASDRAPHTVAGGGTATTKMENWTATTKMESPNDYSFSSRLGKGAFGVVYAATERVADAEVAVKIIDMAGKSECQRQRAKAEVELWRAIGVHPNIVGLRGSFTENQFMFIVMERCRCDVLYLLRKGCPIKFGPTLSQMLLGIQACHQAAIVHRDIKPENFLVGQDGPSVSVKLCDFGLAARLPLKGGLRGQTGTAPMMSPEMLEGKEYGTGTDVWSFAVVAYLLVFKELPYIPREVTAKEAKRAVMKGETPRKIQGVTDVREKTEAAFLACLLQRAPGRRPSVGEALEHPLLLQAPDPWTQKQPPAFQTKESSDTLAPLDDDILQDDDDSQGEWGVTSTGSASHSNRCSSGSASPNL